MEKPTPGYFNVPIPTAQIDNAEFNQLKWK